MACLLSPVHFFGFTETIAVGVKVCDPNTGARNPKPVENFVNNTPSPYMSIFSAKPTVTEVYCAVDNVVCRGGIPCCRISLVAGMCPLTVVVGSTLNTECLTPEAIVKDLFNCITHFP